MFADIICHILTSNDRNIYSYIECKTYIILLPTYIYYSTILHCIPFTTIRLDSFMFIYTYYQYAVQPIPSNTACDGLLVPAANRMALEHGSHTHPARQAHTELRKTRMARSANRQASHLNVTSYEWLGGKDSNLDKQIQSLPSYRWTTPHQK